MVSEVVAVVGGGLVSGVVYGKWGGGCGGWTCRVSENNESGRCRCLRHVCGCWVKMQTGCVWGKCL